MHTVSSTEGPGPGLGTACHMPSHMLFLSPGDALLDEAHIRRLAPSQLQWHVERSSLALKSKAPNPASSTPTVVL